MFYTKAATARIFKVSPNRVREVRIWAKVIWVSIKGIGCRFVAKRAYLKDFAQVRREGAAALEVNTTLDGSAFLIKGGREDHRVEIQPDATITCDCHDHARQVEVLGRGCCKHVYATIAFLGYESMSRYITLNSKTPQAA